MCAILKMVGNFFPLFRCASITCFISQWFIEFHLQLMLFNLSNLLSIYLAYTLLNRSLKMDAIFNYWTILSLAFLLFSFVLVLYFHLILIDFFWVITSIWEFSIFLNLKFSMTSAPKKIGKKNNKDMCEWF